MKKETKQNKTKQNKKKKKTERNVQKKAKNKKTNKRTNKQKQRYHCDVVLFRFVLGLQQNLFQTNSELLIE